MNQIGEIKIAARVSALKNNNINTKKKKANTTNATPDHRII